MDSQLPRNQWPLGRIVETNIDRHGLVRKISFRKSIKMQKWQLKRFFHFCHMAYLNYGSVCNILNFG